ncbi:MAG: efflux RND transporter permease subunit [Gemmatimonadetes bacterium]|nr:efflux RND transporter permease subunit [Gemmatimonadota bacterium]
MSLPRLSIARPVGVAMFYLAMVFLGVLSFFRLPVDLLPDVAYPRLVVVTNYPEVAPAEVEHFITEPIERQVSTVPGVEHVESVTREGLSLVFLRFAWGSDMDFAALNVRERLDAVRDQLPETADRPVVLRQDPRSEPIMSISVASDGDLWALQQLAEYVFRRRLEQSDGVAQAAVTGGLEREIHVDIDLRRLESYGLTIEQLATALDNANAAGGSGTVRRGQFRYSLRTLGELQAVDEIADIVLKQQPPAGGQGATGPDGRLLVRDVAIVEDGFRERESSATYNGRPAISLLVFKESGANTVKVSRDVEGVLAQLRLAHPGISLDVAMNQAGFISNAIGNLVQNLVLGSALAFLVLFLFLRDWRYPVAIALAIPISIISTFALLDAANVSLNIMSLGGLALGAGMLVDNSIIVLENIVRHREKGLVGAVAAAVGAEELMRALFASTLTTIAVFGPVIYVEGVAGQLFAALSFAVAFSLLTSLIVAITMLPMLSSRWKSGAISEQRTRAEQAHTRVGRAAAARLDGFDRAFARFTAWYERVLVAALSHRQAVVGLSVFALVITIPVVLSLERSVLPDVDQGSFRARIELPKGTPLDRTQAMAAALDSLLRQDDAVNAVLARVGRQTAIAGVQEETSDLNTAVLEVQLNAGESTEDVLARLRPSLSAFPAGSITIETGQATALGKLLGGGEADLAVRVRGDDLDGALVHAERVRQRLMTLPALTNVRTDLELGQPEFLIEINRDRAAAFGLEATAVAEAIENHMRGRVATRFVAFDRKIDVLIRLPEEERRSLETLERLVLGAVPLRELIRVRESVGPVEIQRVDQGRVVPVFADVATGDVEEAVGAIRAALADIPPPSGLRVDVGGENEEFDRSVRDLTFAFMLALLLVYMILAAEFESFIHPFTILLSVPLSLIGAFAGLALFGAGLNTISLIGMVILVGIVDNDAVVKIDFIIQQREKGLAVRDAILEAGRARLRPILMTSVTTMLGVFPMMLGLGAGADLQKPLAVAVFGGLFTSTALTLIVIPVVYEMVDDARAWIVRRRSAARRAGQTDAARETMTAPAGLTPEAE